MKTAFSVTMKNSAGLVAVLAALTAVFSCFLDRFFSPATLQSLLNQIPALTFVSVGMTFVLITGGIDLSAGSLIALTSASLGVLMVQYDWSLLTAVPAVLGIGLFAGLLNGTLSTLGRIPSFIVTLGMLQAARGAALLITGSRMQFIGAAVEPLAKPSPVTGISTAFLLAAACVLLAQFVLTRTVFGRHCVAVGANEQALRLSGINPSRLKIAVFLLSGACAAIAGVIETSRISTGDPGGARGFELLAIAAAVIGGTSLSGGRGSVLQTFLGVLIISVLQTGLAHAGAGEGLRYLITGSVTVGAVAFDAWRNRNA